MNLELKANYSLVQWSNFLTFASGFIGIVVILGWSFGIDNFNFSDPGLRAINPLAAICFIFCALSLWLQNNGNEDHLLLRVSQVSAVVVAMVVLIQLYNLVPEVNEINKASGSVTATTSNSIGGINNQLSTNTAVCFILSVLALIFLRTKIQSKWIVSQHLALIIGLFSLLSILGFMYKVPVFEGLSAYFPMSLYPAVSFLCIAIAILLANPHHGFVLHFLGNSDAAVLARKLIPAAILIPIVLGHFAIYADQSGFVHNEMGIALLITSTILVFMGLIWRNVQNLNKRELQRKKMMGQIKIFKHFFSHGNDLLSISDSNGNFEIINPQFQSLLGYAENELINKSMYPLIHPDDLSETAQELLKLSEGEDTVRFENRLRRKDGTYIWLEWNIINDRRSHRMYSVARDITRHKLSKEELSKMNNTLEELVHKKTRELVNSKMKLERAQRIAHLGSWEFDFRTGIAEWSKESCRIYGLDPEENIQSYEDWIAYLHPDDKILVMEAIESSRYNLTPLQIHHRIIKNNGDIRHIYSEAIFDFEGGTATGLYGISHDITDLKVAEEEIRDLNQSLEKKVEKRTAELKAANKELESFSYSISHDLRAPLRAINGYSNILKDEAGEKLDRESRRIVNNIMDNALKMGQLIDGLLEFSRLNRTQIRRQKVDMQQMVSETIEEVQNDADVQNIHFNIKKLWPALADSTSMKQVWINLISNAIKYSSSKEQIRIEIGSKKDKKNKYTYYIKDNGVGFDMRYSEKLFDVFTRLHTDEEFEGTGVGLALVHRIVTKHGGEVWANSKPGKGAEFHFHLGDKT